MGSAYIHMFMRLRFQFSYDNIQVSLTPPIDDAYNNNLNMPKHLVLTFPHCCFLFLSLSFVTPMALADEQQMKTSQPRLSTPTSCVKPEYPKESLRNDEQGTVTLLLSITGEGAVSHTRVAKSSGFELLDARAAEAFASCRFIPALQDGTPVASEVKMEYVWKIEPPSVASTASRQVPKAAYLRQDAPTGSNIRRSSVTSALPVNKRYHELTDDQKAYLHASYESMGEGDEPPYPRDGLESLYAAIGRVQQALQVEGRLSFEVRVDGKGQATAVDFLSSPSPEMTNAVGRVAMLMPYKPALCKGQPCTMSFPVRFNLHLRR
jgi:TonB family protein